MLEPLGRCRRHSTLFQFASNGLRDFIDPSKGARSAASVQWPGVSSPGCPLNALSRSAPLAGPQDFRWRWTVAPRMSAAAAFLPLFGPWVSRSSPREPKPRSDLSAGRYGWLCGGARPPPSPESFGHRGRGQLPPLPGAPAPVSSEGPDQGHHEHPERTTRTNNQNEHPDAALASVPVNAGLAAPVHLRLLPGRLEPHGCTRLPASPARRHAGLRYGAPPPRPFALTSLRGDTQFPSPSDVRRPAYPVWGLELRCPPGPGIGRMPSGQFRACPCEGRGYRPVDFQSH